MAGSVEPIENFGVSVRYISVYRFRLPPNSLLRRDCEYRHAPFLGFRGLSPFLAPRQQMHHIVLGIGMWLYGDTQAIVVSPPGDTFRLSEKMKEELGRRAMRDL